MDIKSLSLSRAAELYRDWLNNFLTVGAFADYYGIDDTDASDLIEAGRILHDMGF